MLKNIREYKVTNGLEKFEIAVPDRMNSDWLFGLEYNSYFSYKVQLIYYPATGTTRAYYVYDGYKKHPMSMNKFNTYLKDGMIQPMNTFKPERSSYTDRGVI